MAKKTVYILLTSAIAMAGQIRSAGEVVECDDALAKDLMHRGKGRLADAGDAPSDDDLNYDEKPLAEHTVAELKEIADDYQIDGADGMKKADLIKAIEAAEAESGSE